MFYKIYLLKRLETVLKGVQITLKKVYKSHF